MPDICLKCIGITSIILLYLLLFRYFLQPRSGKNKPNTCSTPPGNRLSVDNSLGSLRLQVQYTADHVFPAHVYDPLRSLLLDSVNTKVSDNH